MTKRAGVASPKNLTDAPKVVTANRVGDGAVVFRARDGSWTRVVAAAEIVDGPAAEALLEAAKADAARAIVVEPYLIDMEAGADGPRPIALRERIRAEGPTFAQVFDKPWVEA